MPAEAPAAHARRASPGSIRKCTLAAFHISGQDIGSPARADMPLVAGGFTSGDVDTSDYLAGNFHGPDHEETYGVFDTGNYVGAFGARRNP